MGIAARQQECIAVIVVAMLAWNSFAEDAPRRATSSSRRGESVVFSGTVTDSASTNLTLTNASAAFTIGAATNDPQRYFRARSGP